MSSCAKLKWLSFLLFLGGAATQALGTDFADNFADREVITNAPVTITGSNTIASLETSEPLLAGKIGGHSVWIAWVAPSNGLVTLTTAGSSFDTLLGVFRPESSLFPRLDELDHIAANDDAGTNKYSQLQFGARAGVEYEIAIDGFGGATGDITLTLNFAPSTSFLPQVLRQPGDQSLRLGDTLILTFDILAPPQLELQWFLNGAPVPDADRPTLVVRNLQTNDLGLYSLMLTVGDAQFLTSTIEVEVNSEGRVSVLARNKLEDSTSSGLTPVSGGGSDEVRSRAKAVGAAGLSGGVVLGYDGVQIFNTTYATSDPAEPQHCGIVGGASYWFSYVAPTNGVMSLDTDGSTFDTILAVYTYNPPLLGYADLIPVACDDNSGSNGLTSRLEFTTETARNYFVVIDGVNAARGVAYLHYHLTTTNPPVDVAPVLLQHPQPLVVASGTTVVLGCLAGGTAPLQYQWQRNGKRLPSQTAPSLTLSSPQAADAGVYTVTVSNLLGAVTSTGAVVQVLSSSMMMMMGPQTNQLVAAFPATRGFQYAIDSSSLLATNGWVPLATALTDYGGIVWVTNSVDNASCFLRLRRP